MPDLNKPSFLILFFGKFKKPACQSRLRRRQAGKKNKMNKCEQLKQEYENLKTLQADFKVALNSRDIAKIQELKPEITTKMAELSDKLWPFEGLSLAKFKEQYEKTVSGYKECGWLKILSSGKEGIIDEQGNEHPIYSLQEIKQKLLANRELYAEKFAVMENPRVHLTPFALSPKLMADDYAEEIENHFVESRIKGDKRIPDENRTKLFGIDGESLALRADKQNVYFSDDLNNLSYFPEWIKEGNKIKAKGGIAKAEAVAKTGGWHISIIEAIPKAPSAGEGKVMEKEIKIKGKTKKVKRKQVEGGLDASEQYELLKSQNEAGFTPEDWISFATLYLKENNIVLDDDRNTNYYCRLLGVASASSFAPGACWSHGYRQAYLSRGDPGNRDGGFGARGRVRV